MVLPGRPCFAADQPRLPTGESLSVSTSDAAVVSLLVSVDHDGALARRDGVHYRRPAEIDRIARLTRSRAIIVGRRTFSALSMIPPDRWFLVVTGDEDLLAEGGVRYLSGFGHWFMPTFGEALASARSLSRRASAPELFVLGGPQLLAEALSLATRLYRMPADAPAVTGAPELPSATTHGWRQVFREGGTRAEMLEIIERASSKR